jgi:signal transduction histidine kinase
VRRGNKAARDRISSGDDMPAVAAVLLAWSAIAMYACLFHGTLYYYRRRRAHAHLAFALLCATHVGYSYGLAQGLRAETWQSAAWATEIQMAAGLLMAAAFFQFAMTLTGSSLTRFAPAAWVSMSVGAVAALLGLGAIVPEHDVWQDAGLGFDDARRLVAVPSLVGGAFAFASIGWSSVGLATLFRRARDGTEARVIAGVSLPAIAISFYQVSVRVGGGMVPWLVDLTCIPIATAAGLVLLRRFARSASELSAQSMELEVSYEQLRRTQETLVRKQQLAAVGELSAVIAHEVRNPLAILKNAVSGLRQRALGIEDRRVLLGIVNEETDRLARLVRDLLAYARPLSPVRAPTKLRELIERAWEDPRLQKSRGEAQLAIDIPQGIAVTVDREHASYAIVNVLDNALVAMAGRGTITVRAKTAELGTRGAGVAVEIEDEGPGMEPQVLGKARDPFFTTRPAGTGLGLAIVERVMRGHDGTLVIESQLGRGTLVRLAFPAWDPASEPLLAAPLTESRA